LRPALVCFLGNALVANKRMDQAQSGRGVVVTLLEQKTPVRGANARQCDHKVPGCKLSSFGVYLYHCLSARRAGRIGCEAALKAASEVERSGTERFSGFRRA
jgi:hypothetical protein